MNWNELSADVDMWISNFDEGRGGFALDRVVIHHNAGKAMTHAGVYGAFTNNGTSAHYNVDIDGNICQFVHDSDTAWHCPGVNKKSIGIEHANCSGAEGGWDVGDETIDAGAHLTAAICRAYGLGRPEWRSNVFPHSDFYSTACPASLRDKYAGEYIEKAQAYYDNLDAELLNKEGWVSQDGGWWYRLEGGSWETGWFPVNDKWYYANEKGWLQVGWQHIDGKWYFLHNTHDTRYGEMETGWIKDGEHWFLLNDKGQMQTGWQLDKGKWYYLEENGAMRTGWLSYKGDDYFFTDTGAMAVGLYQTRLDGACSIFGEDGKLLHGRIVVEQDSNGIVKLVESK
jgi:N-acetylmuramoyl-L-alanine amidase family 2|nr:MAG TPA: N acetylmuramoyl L alanine amidase endolysin [Caudoviricetes sp.]